PLNACTNSGKRYVAHSSVFRSALPQRARLFFGGASAFTFHLHSRSHRCSICFVGCIGQRWLGIDPAQRAESTAVRRLPPPEAALDKAAYKSSSEICRAPPRLR